MAKTKGSKKGKRKSAKSDQPGWFASLEPEQRRRVVRVSSGIIALLIAAVGASIGMNKLERRVQGHERFAGPPEIVLIAAPQGLESIILDRLAPLTATVWTDPQLCELVVAELNRVAWVRKVESVRRIPPGRIEVRCEYRTPAAMVQDRGEFVLIDSERVRLPGRYPFSTAYPLIQGVAATPPEAGQQWDVPDLAAGLAIHERLGPEPFVDQVTAVRVHNYRGRENPHLGHIVLATDRAGGRIIWGSAPGEEIEENSTDQKLVILRRNHEQYGRIDAGRAVIDISTFPGQFTTPAGAADGAGEIALRRNQG